MATQIELNPPDGGNGGWGFETDTLDQKTLAEQRAAGDNEDAGLYSTVGALVTAKGEPSPMENAIIEAMPYEAGWDCDYADQIMYGGVPYVDQNPVGSCVGAGAGSAVASKVSTEILLEGDPENPFASSVANHVNNADRSAVPLIDYHYGCGKMLDWWDGERFTTSRRLGDGSFCSSQIKALKIMGVLPCSKVIDKGYEFPQSQDIRANAGNQNQFLNRHLAAGQAHLMGDSVRVRSADDLKEVLTVLKQPCMICSGWGFRSDRQVDGLGWVSKHSGSWAHNMSLVAYVTVGGNEYVKVRNQWGPNAHKDGWSFWVTVETFAKWIKQAECQSIGELTLIPSEHTPSFPF